VTGTSAEAGAGDPLAALKALSAMADAKGTTLLLLHNFHRFLTSAEVVQTAFAQLVAGKQQRTFIVVLSPIVQIPVELEKLFVVLEQPLPDREQLERIARELTSDHPDDLPQGNDLQRILDAAAGLTRYEAEGAFALSLARHNAMRPEVIWDLKAQTLRKNNLLRLHRGKEAFESLGGLANLKSFCSRALQPGKKVKPRGLLLLGVPGSGKSCFARALGNETGRPTLVLDMGSLYGSLVGSTEQNVRQALRIADAMSPCLLFCDELDKGLAGVGGQGDSGVSTRLFGTLLTWLAEHESDVFFIGTANNISMLPPEFTRAERLDGVFFLDVPNVAERDQIWKMYRAEFEIPESQSRPDDTSWTGAEIRSCCRLSALLDITLHQAAQHVVPVAVTAAEAMEKLKTWASGRCLDASNPGIYARDGKPLPKPGRRVQRPSDN
jgi:SpoVK/Ycf46/Vps4 family AAA+-type ATPase